LKKLMGFSLQLAKLLFLFLLLPSLSSISAQTKIHQLGVPFKLRDLAKRFIYESTNTTIDTLDIPFLRGNGAGLTGITGATGGVANADNTTIGSDTDSDGTGTLAFQTQLTNRMRVLPGGDILFGDNEILLHAGVTHEQAITAIGSYDIVRLPAGTINVAADTFAVYNQDNWRLTGAGIDKTFIRGTGQEVMHIMECDNIIIEHLTIIGGITRGLRVDSSNVVTVRFVEIDSSGGTNAFVFCNDSRFESNVVHSVHGSGASGFELFNCQRSVIENSLSYLNNNSGFMLYESDHCIVSNNRTYNNGGSGIFFNGAAVGSYGSDFNVVSHNTSYEDSSAGIRIDKDADRNVISNNTVDGNSVGVYGLNYTDGDSNLIVYNSMSNFATAAYNGSGLYTRNIFSTDERIQYFGKYGHTSNRDWHVLPNSDLSGPTAILEQGLKVVRDSSTTNQYITMNYQGGAGNIVATVETTGGFLRFNSSDGTTTKFWAELNADGGWSMGDNFTDSGGAGTLNVENGIDLGNSGMFMQVDTLGIGVWDMDTDSSKVIAHGFTLANLINIVIQIKSDAGNLYPLFYQQAGDWIVDATNVTLYRVASGFFDSSLFNGAGARGVIFLFHKN